MSEPSQSKPGTGVPASIGRYQVVRTLGKGSMGVVYLAHDPVLERDVALKVMAAQMADDGDLKGRFAREAKAVAKMTHPNVVTVFDLGYHEGAPYIAMELLKGHDLSKAMRATPPLSLERKIGIVLQMLAGLAHAHHVGIVHRDIKPANIFICADGSVKITDFGVARLTSASMTGTGNIIGTADYMSPEQVKGTRVDGRSDLFSVGCVLYELLTGRRPYHAENLMAIFYKITHEEVNFGLLPQGPAYEALLPILKKAMAKDLEARHQTAYEMSIELKEYLHVHASSQSAARHALEGLLDIEPDMRTPAPLTDAPGVGTGANGPARTLRADPTLQGRGTVVPGTPPTVRGVEPTVITGGVGDAPLAGAPPAGVAARPRPAVRRPPVRTAPARPTPAAPASRRALVYAGGAVLVAVAGLAGYLWLPWLRPATPPGPVPVSQAVAPSPAAPGTLSAEAVAAENRVRDLEQRLKTLEAERSAAETKAAEEARTRVVTQAAAQGQQVDPAAVERAQQEARRKAQAEQERRQREERARLEQEQRAAEAQRKAEQERQAQLEAQKALEAQQKAQADAQQKAQQQKAQLAERLGGLLGQADGALAAQSYEAAIGLYDEALKLDPQNARALQGRSGALTAQAIARASAGARAAPAKAFVASRTVASSTEVRPGNTPDGFQMDDKVSVKRATQAAELPGKILFEVEPAAVKPGEGYRVRIWLLNEGSAPIQVREMVVSTKINGRGARAPVPAQTKDVAPQQKALLREVPDFWREDIESWSMEVVVRTARGETYTNQVTWK
jgi:eukaryotic-like serine/threonine-protein kinase